MGMMINRRRACGGKKGLPYGAVDMGLPSGTLWAQGNIVKDANGNYAIGEPTDYGCYFSWGNIDGHNEYSEDQYDFSSDNYSLTPGGQLSESISSDDVLHDAAVARIGGNWHMPTTNSYIELFNNNYTTRQWVQINGVNGYLLTSVVNGNTLFMSASGMRTGKQHGDNGTAGHQWSSILYSSTHPFGLFFRENSVYVTNRDYSRRCGFNIRPIIKV